MYLLDPFDRALARRALDRLEAAELAEDAEYLSQDLKEFMVAAWHLVEPTTEFIDGWHIDAICEHLEAVARGEIKRLYVTMPPSHMKTGLCSVMFPAWLWTRQPGLRLLTACWSKDFAERDAMASKLIIESRWFQRRWPLPLRKDTNSKSRYENAKRGYRVTTTPGGRATGEGGGLVVIDDPISMGDIWSPAARAKVMRWWTSVLPTRIRNHKPGAIVMVGQRGHEMDPIGFALKQQLPGAVHLNLPARYDRARRIDTRWFKDPRRIQGEPLWPAVYSEEKLRELTAQMTPQDVAAQLQQTPQVDGGAIISRDWWRLWTEWDLPPCSYFILSIDPSVKGGMQNDAWAVQLWGAFEHLDLNPALRLEDKNPRLKVLAASQRTEPTYNLMLLAAWTKILQYPEAKRRILQMISDWTDPESGQAFDEVLVEDKAAGPILIIDLENSDIPGVSGSDPGIKDKAARAHVVSDAWFSGRIWVPTKKLVGTGRRDSSILPTWAEEVVHQCAIFPAGEADDHVDAATQAVKRFRDIGFLELDTDHDRTASDGGEEPRPESAYGS